MQEHHFGVTGIGLIAFGMLIAGLRVVAPAGAQDTKRHVTYGTVHPLSGTILFWDDTGSGPPSWQ